jgi:hypothetical protein
MIGDGSLQEGSHRPGMVFVSRKNEWETNLIDGPTALVLRLDKYLIMLKYRWCAV